ncbi:hypothetical protein IE81DRAFT_341521 [Ceraceosorus guamensis]|uniref:Uncharacterized protein n=1 Tax=Ceraceosorus guamensis TaxID=1522189 RepID=A0A316VY18_9BASI|nr:hypothetical protein IE81DRAFT_341521 [Ceraceosorus guamensis]PWN42342.1 hypothetical protein IE81DRAFT_341521 [Ceraceosorus guamensis]
MGQLTSQYFAEGPASSASARAASTPLWTALPLQRELERNFFHSIDAYEGALSGSGRIRVRAIDHRFLEDLLSVVALSIPVLETLQQLLPDTDSPFWQLKAELPRFNSLQVQTALRPRDPPQHTSRTSRRSTRQRETEAISEAHLCIMRARQEYDSYSDLERVEHYGNFRAALLTLSHEVRRITDPAARSRVRSDSASVRSKLDRFEAGFVDRVPAVARFALSQLESLRLREQHLALMRQRGQSEALEDARVSLQIAQGVLDRFEVEQGVPSETDSWLYSWTQSS